MRAPASTIRAQANRPAQIRLVDAAVQIATIVALIVTVTSFFGTAWWFLELFSHFRLQMACGSLALLILAVWLRRGATAFTVALIAIANAGPLMPYFLPVAHQRHAVAGQFSVMVANVGLHNGDYTALIETIEHENPDIVGLLEVDARWVEHLAALHSDYSFSVLRPEDGAYGIALYSKLPVHETVSSPYAANGIQTAVSVNLDLQGEPATLLLAHLMAPVTASRARLRNEQINQIARTVKENGNDRAMLLGDLNLTPWSPYFAVLERDSGLASAARGRGYLGTWPTRPSLFRIPIDHCLVSDGLQVQEIRTGPDIGSDHLPLLVDIAVTDIAHRVNSAE